MLTTSPYPPYRILDIIDDANNLTMTSPQSQAFWRRLRGCRLLRGLQVDCKRVPECKLQAVHEWLTRTSLLSYSMNTGHRTKLNNSPFWPSIVFILSRIHKKRAVIKQLFFYRSLMFFAVKQLFYEVRQYKGTFLNAFIIVFRFKGLLPIGFPC